MTDLLLATTNPGKQREYRLLLEGLPGRIVTPGEIGLDLQVEEPYDTYAENATTKAEAYCAASGLLTLADDSGLEVAALDWGPGVHTAYYGGSQVTDKVGHLLAETDGATDRRARMVCVIAIGIPNATGPRVELFRGEMEGTLALQRYGEGGFGYDPVFLLPSGVTTAQLPEAEKNQISHRGRAAAAARPRLIELLS
ncbi:MAG TPA: non-canonical purine NTP pyrophosphatase [Candidatus Limnocylindria bacterium]|nr:non-canonical purine NTP pyrophosphatase [Candidatus Limnocylindria bacterium]